MRKLLLYLVLLGSVGLAEDVEVTELTILTQPPGATVRYGKAEWGITGRPIEIKHSSLAGKGTHLSLDLRKENYEKYDYKIPVDKFLGTAELTYPEQPIQLKPKHALVPVLENPFPYLLGLCFFTALGYGGYRLRAQSKEVLAKDEKFQALASVIPKHDLLGLNFGNYRLLDKIGEGGLARVFRALPEDSLDEGEAVAAKVLHPELGKEKDHRERFVREGLVSKDLHHPNVVKLYEMSTKGDLIYIILELISGQTLKEARDGKPLPLPEAKRLLEQILAGLVYAHKRGVVHRDLTPSNIMIRDDGVVKIMDFGLARRREVDKTVTLTGVIQGTPGYMAPEQIQGEVDPRIDQYALGIVIFEMLSGQKPFEGLDTLPLLMRTASQEIPNLKDIGLAQIPDSVAAYVARLTRLKPEERFASLSEAEQAFHEAWKSVKDSEPH